MGAVNFSLDVRLVNALKKALPFPVFFETGTFKGDTVNIMLPLFDRLITAELSEPLWSEVTNRFAGEKRVEPYLGNSPDIISQFQPELKDTSVLFWLDAHWCVADDTSGEQSQCPLLQEILAIGQLNDQSIILIDDARLFLAPPPAPHESSQWPSFDKIINALHHLSNQHELMVINDVIAYYPIIAREYITNYAREVGVDWLRAHQSLVENSALREAFEEKHEALMQITKSLEVKDEALMQITKSLEEKHEALMHVMNILEEKDVVIKELNNEIKALHIKITNKRQIKWLRKSRQRLNSVFSFRLGHLIQHPPKKMCLPAHYSQPIHATRPPKISIVTPSYKQAVFIERTIQSVLDQHYPDLEYFIQDGGSQDGTEEILSGYTDRLTGWESRPDSGQSQAINLGFAKTSGEIMAWLNSDDILLPGSLAYVANYFNRHPKVDVVYGHRMLIDENDEQIGRWMLPKHDNEVLSWGDYIPQETLFWRRSIWDKAGGHIDESFRFAMDWDLLIRFREAGARFARLPRFLGGFRIHVHQKTSAGISGIGIQEMTRIRERELGRVPSDAEIYRAVTPYMRKHLATDLSWRIWNKLGRPF
jgi:Glycosyl transferase family 2